MTVPWPSTSAARSWRRPWSTGGGRSSIAAQVPTAAATRTPSSCSPRCVDAGRRRCARPRRRWPTPVVCGVGCGGPMTRGGETVSPLNIPAWRDFPLRGRLAELARPARASSTTTPRRWPWARAGRARRVGVPDYLAMVVSTGVGGGHRARRPAARRRATATPATSATSSSSPTAARCGCGGRGCLEAEASGTAIAAITGRPAAEAGARGRRARPARSSAGPWRRWPTCSTCASRVVAGSVALGFGEPFFAAAQAELDAPGPPRLRRRLHASVPAGLGADGPLVGAAAVGWRGLRGSDARPTSA